jgi:NAD(P)-dependent dehydrogenase (short-subunit alcohol dehydrogenase family)
LQVRRRVVVDDDEAVDALDFSGRVVIVTGGSRGVGRAVVSSFLAHGASVVACGRNEPGEDDELFAPGSGRTDAAFVVADIREADQARNVISQAVERFGRVDVLVNNAGGSPNVAAADASPRFVASIVTLNLLAPYYCAQAANAVMQEQDDGGCILNIGSVSGLRPSPGSSAYGAAKAGLVNLTETLAMEWAPKVRVNCVSAGLLDTGSGEDFYGGPEGLARVAATVPLGRMGVPADVAGLCLLLASPLASFVSGANLVADGGGEWPPYLAAAQAKS